MSGSQSFEQVASGTKGCFFDTNKINPITMLSILLWPHKPVLVLMPQNALLVI